MLRIDVVDRDLIRVLDKMRRALQGDMRPVMQAIGSRLERNIHMRFDTKTAPDGSPWPAWSPETASARAAEGRGTLLEYTGRMRDSLTYLADSVSVEVGFGVPYAFFHETGAGRLPKRALLLDDGQLSAEDQQDALEAAMAAFRKQLNLQ